MREEVVWLLKVDGRILPCSDPLVSSSPHAFNGVRHDVSILPLNLDHRLLFHVDTHLGHVVRLLVHEYLIVYRCPHKPRREVHTVPHEAVLSPRRASHRSAEYLSRCIANSDIDPLLIEGVSDG